MNQIQRIRFRACLLIAAIAVLCLASSQLRADTGTCNGASITLPFTDVPASNGFFCSIASAYISALMSGTSSTTFSPSANVTRDQMSAFVSRTLDQSLRRGGKRAALNQWWTPSSIPEEAKTEVGDQPVGVQSDGRDLWVANRFSGTVSRVQASDGRVIDTWRGAFTSHGVLVARERVFVTAVTSPGKLYSIDPKQTGGPVTIQSQALGDNPRGIAYDGSRIWTANGSGSVSIMSFICIGPCVSTVSTGFSALGTLLYDGSNMWVTDGGDNTIKKLDGGGAILQSIPLPADPNQPAFDGTNIWVPNSNNSITVIRVKGALGNPLPQPFVLATLTGNGLNSPSSAAFDGQRILVTNNGGNSVSLWTATDLIPLGSFATG